MTMLEVKLRTRSNGDPRWAFLRELTGEEEMLASAPGVAAATELVARLLVAAPGSALRPEDAWSLSVDDRDRLIAGLYLHHFGDTIESRIECGRCGQAFGLDFSLRAVLEQIDRTADATREQIRISGPHEDGSYALADGARFRLPTTSDERQLAGLEAVARADRLFRTCRLLGASERLEESEGEREALEQALAAEAPVLSLPVPVSCVHCGAEQEVDFDVVAYFTASLERERPLLTREVHALARAYRWSFDEIVRLTRRQRHAHVELVEAERGALEMEP